MNLREWFLAAICCAALLTVQLRPARAQAEKTSEASGPYGTLLIRGATVIDGTGSPARGPMDIVIKNNVIADVFPSDPIAMGRVGGAVPVATPDRIIDAHGMYVMPGIIDVHTHMGRAPNDYIYKLLLGQGITTMRVFNVNSGKPDDMVAEKRKIAANQVNGPRMYVYPFWQGDSPGDARISNPDGAREIVREWKAKGVDGVKILGKPGLYPDVLRAICDEARKNGMGVAVHIGQDSVYPMNAVEVAGAGVSTIEHHYGYAEAAFSDRTIQDLPPDYNYASEPDRFLYTGKVWLETDLKKLHGEEIDTLLAIAQKTGFTMVPTFVVYEGNRDVARVQTLPWHDRFTLPAVMDFWRPNPEHHASFYYHWTSSDEAVWAQMYRRWFDFVNDFKNRGGQVAVGSDPGSMYDLWGFGTIRELEMLEQAGFTPLETIHSATEVGAHALGNDRLGVIRPGYLADLVVLTQNPLEDMKVFYGTGVDRVMADGKVQHVAGVKYTIRDGVIFDAQAMLRDVEEMVRQAKQKPAKSN